MKRSISAVAMNDPIRIDEHGEPFVVVHHSLARGVAYALDLWLSERARNGAMTDLGYGSIVSACRAVDAQQAMRSSSPSGTKLAVPGPTMRWFTTHEAAQQLGYSSRWIQKLCDAGAFEGAVRKGRDWQIPQAAVELRKRA